MLQKHQIPSPFWEHYEEIKRAWASSLHLGSEGRFCVVHIFPHFAFPNRWWFCVFLIIINVTKRYVYIRFWRLTWGAKRRIRTADNWDENCTFFFLFVFLRQEKKNNAQRQTRNPNWIWKAIHLLQFNFFRIKLNLTTCYKSNQIFIIDRTCTILDAALGNTSKSNMDKRRAGS